MALKDMLKDKLKDMPLKMFRYKDIKMKNIKKIGMIQEGSLSFVLCPLLV